MNSLHFTVDQRQRQSLSPRLQHAVRLLQMSSLDFAALVRQKLGDNPFLEGEECEDGEPAPAPQDGAGPAAGAEQGADSEAPASPADTDEGADSGPSMDAEREPWSADGAPGQRAAEDGDYSALDAMAVEMPLNTHLHAQLDLLQLPERDLALARILVESLDDDGYLRTPLEELTQMPGLDPAPALEELQIALRRVQSLEPAGVAARSVAECLQLQLPGIACPVVRALARRIVEEQLPALASGDLALLARQLKEPLPRVEEACRRIRRLDPRPGWRVGPSQIAYVVPDVIVRKVRGEWTVQLNPAVVPKVRLNEVYAQLFQRHRSAQDSEMGAHLQDARWTLRNVALRFATILDVAEAIVRRQRSFLEYGAMAMKPLGLREIAEELGIHESTVSRVTNNKYMATPVGVFELKHFFSRAMISANGSACSGTAIRSLIKDIIEGEGPQAPLSDAEITRLLARQGLVVARRTVTKYRQMLRIEPVDRRRRTAA